jgi:hypothetical protein
MDKKELKLYVTPAQEIIKLELEGHLLEASVDPDQGSWILGASEDDGLDEE